MARAVVEDGRDTSAALRRAAQGLGLRMPIAGLDQKEVYAAVASYRQMFHPLQQARVTDGRRLALEAMRSLAKFSPRLIGGLAHGGDRIDLVQLLLWAATPEDVLFELGNLGIPWQSGEAALDYGGRRSRVVPIARFVAGETAVRLLILPLASRGERPLDPIDRRPVTALTEAALARLLEAPNT